MSKSLLYRMFGLGKLPGKVRPTLEAEGIVVMDEGMPGRFVTAHVDGPRRRYRNRSEGFSGSLVVTQRRVFCATYGKRQINIATDDEKVSNLYVDAPASDRLSLSFESGDFREGWRGVIEFRFRTEKASQFHDALLAIGAQKGTAPQANR